MSSELTPNIFDGITKIILMCCDSAHHQVGQKEGPITNQIQRTSLKETTRRTEEYYHV